MKNGKIISIATSVGLLLGLARALGGTAAGIFGEPQWLFDSFPLAVVMMAVTVIGMIYGGYQLKSQQYHQISLQEGFLVMLGIYAVAGLVVVVYNSIFFHLIRPDWVIEEYAFRLTANGIIKEYFSSLVFGSILAPDFCTGHFQKTQNRPGFLMETSKICELCEREVSHTTRHHLIPRTVHRNKWFRKRYSREELQETIDLCLPCHRQLHLFFSHKELGRNFNRLEDIRNDPKVRSFVSWLKRR